ncbi:hypothetical protein [Halomonas sp. BM-2019]|uniref:hypothetical protein n=1 Tax=Halomonas sp. BM-2019 TaxID=2811227 RepID=UPI001B3C397E|nr:MAG: hypothetical protein J5F18_09565 [Halomonas sp. BM-2019]
MKTGSALAPLLACLAIAAAPLVAADASPAFTGQDSELMRLDNGLVIEGRDIDTPDGYTAGFRLIAGFTPLRLPRLDLGAEFAYRESDEVPTRLGDQSLLVNSVSLGGSLMAGVRLGQLGLYVKSGIAGWEGDAVIPQDALNTAGTTRVTGLGARLQLDRVISRLEFEEFNAPDMAHHNLLSASLHFPF